MIETDLCTNTPNIITLTSRYQRWIENIFVAWKFYILGQKGTKMEN